MAVVDHAEVVLEEIRNGSDRFEELHEELEDDPEDLAVTLFALVERGDIALLPIGDSVVIRDEEKAP